jgi:hypothetical protein
MRSLLPTSAGLLAAILALLGTDCGAGSATTPFACLRGPNAYLSALSRAPGGARLGGQVPISSCLPKDQPEGELATVGTTMIIAATRLNVEARGEPGGAANLRLGYLLGAAERGAQRTAGIDAELLRRLGVAARYSPRGRALGMVFLRTYRRGYAAGDARG